MLSYEETNSESGEHLHFETIKRKKGDMRKLPRYAVFNYRNDKLGEVAFSGRWRQFVLFPGEKTMWSKGCLEIVNKFLTLKTKKWRRDKYRQARKRIDAESEGGAMLPYMQPRKKE